MRAMVLHNFGQPLQPENGRDPDARRRQLLIKALACGVWCR